MRVGEVLERVRIVDGGAMVGHLDMAPAFERRVHHEQIGRAVAGVLVVDPRRPPGRRRLRRARLGDQLLRGLVEADDRPLRVVRPGVDFQHVLHRSYESAARLGRNDPVLAAVRLERVFLSVRWIVVSLARLTMPSSTTFVSRRRRLQRAWPSGGCEQASAINRASAAPSKILSTDGVARGLRLKTASSPSSTNCLRVR